MRDKPIVGCVGIVIVLQFANVKSGINDVAIIGGVDEVKALQEHCVVALVGVEDDAV